MTRTVKVTSAQVKAARLKVKRSAASGRPVSPGVSAIANARRHEVPSTGRGWEVTKPGASRVRADTATQAQAIDLAGDVGSNVDGAEVLVIDIAGADTGESANVTASDIRSASEA